jgi:hypothetical protein
MKNVEFVYALQETILNIWYDTWYYFLDYDILYTHLLPDISFSLSHSLTVLGACSAYVSSMHCIFFMPVPFCHALQLYFPAILVSLSVTFNDNGCVPYKYTNNNII